MKKVAMALCAYTSIGILSASGAISSAQYAAMPVREGTVQSVAVQPIYKTMPVATQQPMHKQPIAVQPVYTTMPVHKHSEAMQPARKRALYETRSARQQMQPVRYVDTKQLKENKKAIREDFRESMKDLKQRQKEQKKSLKTQQQAEIKAQKQAAEDQIRRIKEQNQTTLQQMRREDQNERTALQERHEQERAALMAQRDRRLHGVTGAAIPTVAKHAAE